MSSVILYKFRSGTTFEALPLPGTSARLFDVKKGIVKAKKLDSGAMDFELEVHDATTNQQYVDESMLLPRGTRLIVRRVGAARGQGFVIRMQRAESGMGHVGQASRTAAPTGFYTIESSRGDDDEFVSTSRGDDEKELAALMAATETVQNPIAGVRSSAGGGYRPAGSGPPPQGRPGAGGGGTGFNKQPFNRPNADPELRAQEQQSMPKKRATGIPRTFLNLSAPPVTDGLNMDGELENVPRLQPNAIGFEELVNRRGGQSENAAGTKRDLDYALKLTASTIPEHLQCAICKGVAKNAMLLPWDMEGRTACETCIRDGLAQNGFRCPITGNEGVSPDELIANQPLRKAVDLFVQGVLEKMDDIIKQQVDEPDQDNEAALASNEFEGDTGEKGVIVSKKTRKDHRSKHDDDDPFGGGDDDFGGDVFAVEVPNTEEDELDEGKKEDDPVEKVDNTMHAEAIDKSKPVEKPQLEKPEKSEQFGEIKKQEIVSKPNELPETQEKDRREARKQRVLPTGYHMGPAGGATVPVTPSGDVDSRSDDFHGGGFRGRGRGWDRGGGFRGGRGGREGRGGRGYGGRGRFDDFDSGRGGYHPRDGAYHGDDRGQEVVDDNRGTKRVRSYSGEKGGGDDQLRHNNDRDYRRGGGGEDDWEVDSNGGGRGGGRGRFDRGPPPGPPSGRFDDRRGPPPGRGPRGRGGRGGGFRGRGGFGGRGRY